VLIGGEAGVGKTTLCTAFSVLVAGRAELVRGDCVPLGGEGLPYAPIVGLVHDLADRYGTDQVLRWAGAGAAELRWLVPDFGEPEDAVDASVPQNRLRLFETVVRLVEQAAARMPLIVMIEDLHWADDSSRHLIDFMVRALADAPLLLILTFRSDEMTRRHPLRPFLAELGRLPTVHRLEVAPLDEAATTELVTAMTGHRDDGAALVRRMVKSSGGIPYFATELVRASNTVGINLPETLRETLLLRVSRVGDDAQQLLRTIAVGGNRVEHELIAAVSEQPADRLEMILREAVEASLLVGDRSGYAFRHALMREVLVDDLLPGEQVRLHRAYIKALEQDGRLLPKAVRAVELSRHSYAARDNQAAFRWSVEAARLQRYGFNEALQHYERALELWDVVERPAAVAGPLPELLDEAAHAANESGDVERSLALIEEALRVAGPDVDPVVTARRLARKARRKLSLVQPGVLALIDQAVALVPAEPPSSNRAKALEHRAMIRLLLDKPNAVASAQEAIAAAQEAGDPVIEGSARNTLGCALITLGIDPDRGLAELSRAGELATDELHLMRYHINLSDSLILLGRSQEALAVAAEGRQVAARTGRERLTGVMIAGNAAEAAMAVGDWAMARELISWAMPLTRPGNHWIHHRRLLATTLLWMDDDLERAADILSGLRRFSQLNTNGPQYFATLRCNEAELALGSSDPAGAFEIARSAMDSLPWSEPAFDLALLGVAAMAYGRAGDQRTDDQRADDQRADDQRADWADWLRSRLPADPQQPLADQWVPYIEAELAGTVQRWQQAIETMERASAPPHRVAYAYLRLAQQQSAGGAVEEARRSAGTARRLATEMGLKLILRWLDEAGARSGGGAVTQPVPGGLTAREAQVLALVAEGLSNRQIGERLVISTKTASVHVSNILAKLGVASRGEAAARFRAGV
jgi:DNA-binding CsgD family transcriptional regulator/tetratricopeptide (TPR) repeat protein